MELTRLTDQRPASSERDASQSPRSFPAMEDPVRPAPARPPARTVAMQQPVVSTAPLESVSASSELELLEYFDGHVEIVGDDALQVRTVSQGGEEATAWLPIERIPPGERKYISVGAQLRVSILQERKGKRQHHQRVRFVRPTNLPAPSPVVDFLLQRMNSVLRGGKQA